MDVRLLRTAAVHRAHECKHDPDVAESDVEKECECGLLRADGERCVVRFHTYAAVVSHKRSSGLGGEHGQWQALHGAVQLNQCPVRRSTYSSRLVTAQHLHKAYRVGSCRIDQSLQEWALQECSM